ncbi:Predicted membrane protein, contains two CBS domains [Phaffia rhodozyma]|uniref:Predicted membrane protein, contains two CBS domains n=1 Tax=Phaffia rhodozyma TaxID=264483 RepID=A0A0F7SVG4_PHARH|nr:Predicted membrane protein, contains two CBS domains [Phaffia rhodozyma]
MFPTELTGANDTFIVSSHHRDPLTKEEYILRCAISVTLVLTGGVFAGLTLGLMGLDPLHLRVLENSSSDPQERKNAAKVLKLLNKGRHWVLTMLLLGNVIVNESLPIFLDSILGGGIAAVIASTALIVIFGEIIPQSLGVRYGLSIGAFSAPFVLACMYLFSPIAWPIAKLLDFCLGENEEHVKPLRDDEITILNGVLSLNSTQVQDIMTPIKDVMTLSSDVLLDHAKIDEIILSGFSRIPIHEPGRPRAFIGMLLVKKLLHYNPENPQKIAALPLSTLPEATPTINCFQALDYFQTGRAHLLLISSTPGKEGGAMGLISLEDLIEEIIGEEIVDETDRYQDNRCKKAARRTSSAEIMQGIIERERKKFNLNPNGVNGLSRANSIAIIEEGDPNEQTSLLATVSGPQYGSSVLSSSPK